MDFKSSEYLKQRRNQLLSRIEYYDKRISDINGYKKSVINELEELDKNLTGEPMEDVGLIESCEENDDTYDGDDPRCDHEYVSRCRDNWSRRK